MKISRRDGWGLALLGTSTFILILIGIWTSYGRLLYPTAAGASAKEALDLVAQQNMALAAWSMVIVALLSLTATLVTLWLLRSTLRETREARIGEQRAWMEITQVEEDSDLVWKDGLGRLTVHVEARNVGRSPAIDCVIEARFLSGYRLSEIAADFQKHKPVGSGETAFANAPIDTKRDVVIPVSEISASLKALFNAGGPTVHAVIFPKLVVSVQYRLTVDDEWRTTALMYGVELTAFKGTQAQFNPNGGTAIVRLMAAPIYGTMAT